MTTTTKPAPDFTQPIELLMDCHRRIEHFFNALQQLAARNWDGQLRDADREALETGLNYFQQATPRHSTDEETSLFPRLRQCADAQVTVALDRLESDHRRVVAAHEEIEKIGRRWLQNGRIDAAMVEHFAALLAKLAAEYREHIQVEDEDVFVAAARLLSADDLRTIGAEMQARRTADPGRPGSRCAARRRQLS